MTGYKRRRERPYGLLFGKSGHVKKVRGIDPICHCRSIYKRDAGSGIYFCEKCHCPLFRVLVNNTDSVFFSTESPGNKILIKWED